MVFENIYKKNRTDPTLQTSDEKKSIVFNFACLSWTSEIEKISQISGAKRKHDIFTFSLKKTTKKYH